MKCDRCKKAISRNDEMMVVYTRTSAGNKWAYILCAACADALLRFIKPQTEHQGAGGGGGE